MSRPIWFVTLLKKLYPSRKFFARLTHIPAVGRIVDHFLFRDDEVYHLPKDNTVFINADLDAPASTILPSQIVDHFIRQAEQHWVMDFCICRQGDGCSDYPDKLGCIFLGKSVTRINPKLGRRVTREEALAHAHKCREAGLVHTIGRNRLDAVWLGAYPSERLMTICNCCPCCCLWGLAPHLTPDIGQRIKGLPGVQVSANGQCSGCGTCLEGVCIMDALHMEGKQIQISEECRGCGRCVEICPEGAIELTIQDSNHIRNTIDRLSPLVDLS